MQNLTNKKILLGITGGIAAYKSAELVRRLRNEGAEVVVVMTEAAKQFITPTTMQALSGKPVYTDIFDPQINDAMDHIALARWADLLVIAPATADFIAQLAHGHANNLLATLCLASKAQQVVVPAMNQQMWSAPATQANIKILLQRDVKILGPASGEQACGDVGYGRMLEPDEIVGHLQTLFSSNILSNVRILITAGPTQEAIDPVRYLSNHSSGKMGYAIAQAAIEAGAQVTLVSGPVSLVPPPKLHNCISIISAAEMHTAVMKQVKNCDIYIGVAAVADYRVEHPHAQKLKKSQDTLDLKLIRNPDILADVAALAKRPSLVVGFAAETEKMIEHAKQKFTAKKLDMIIADRVGLPDEGFACDNIACHAIWQQGEQDFPLMHKAQMARQLIKLIAERYHQRT